MCQQTTDEMMASTAVVGGESESRAATPTATATSTGGARPTMGPTRSPEEGRTRSKDPKVETLWRIHGKYYDLSEFAHPGGALAVDLLRGQDATAAFEQFHVMNEKHRATLSKLERVGDLAGPATAASAFHAEVKAMVRAHFARHGDGHPLTHKADVWHLSAVAACAAAYARAWAGWWRGDLIWGCVALPCLAWLIMANMAHDGSHGAASKSPLMNEVWLLSASPLLYSYASWYMQHCVSHHFETNDPLSDADLQHHPFAKWHADSDHHTPSGPLEQLFWHATAFLLATLNMSLVHPWKFVVHPLLVFARAHGKNSKTGRDLPEFFDTDNADAARAAKNAGRSDVPHELAFCRVAAGLVRTRFFLVRPHRLVFALVAWLLSLAFVATPWLRFGLTRRAAALALVPFLVTSLVFMIVTQISHVQASCQRPHIQAEPDFFKRQAATSLDYAVSSNVWRFLTGGLNAQSIHHVLPSVSSAHYTALYPKFYAICLKHDCAPRVLPTIAHAFIAHIRFVVRLASTDPRAD